MSKTSHPAIYQCTITHTLVPIILYSVGIHHGKMLQSLVAIYVQAGVTRFILHGKMRQQKLTLIKKKVAERVWEI